MQVGKESSGSSKTRRRTRNQWAEYFKICHEQIRKNPDEQEEDAVKINQDSELSSSSTAFNNPETENIPVASIELEESEKSSDADDSDFDEEYEQMKTGKSVRKNYENGTRNSGRPVKKKARIIMEERDLMDALDSLCKIREPAPVEKIVFLPNKSTLPMKFRFEDDEQSCEREKTQSEKEIDSLFDDLEMGLWECETSCTNSFENEDTISTDTDESPAACCRRGDHYLILDEQIGMICKYCKDVLLDIKHVLPPFYEEPLERYERNDESEESGNSTSTCIDHIQFEGSSCDSNSGFGIGSEKTVFDLIPDSDKELYPHQREGFEFLWRNISGDVHIKNIEKLTTNGGKGCIISHAPGTGKTRLTIVFLQTFLKLYPHCRPVIVAPRGLLLTWEQEFQKWNVDIKFHNLNEMKLSGHESEIADSFFGETGGGDENNKDYVRFAKLCSWMKGESILGIGYQLFERLAGEHVKKKELNVKFRKILLEFPGLLVLDEGHTPRNNQSLVWKALANVKTQRRIILSGTPFQNNFTELYNTLCLVNPKFSHQVVSNSCNHEKFRKKRRTKRTNNGGRGEWASLTSSISKDRTDVDGLKKLRTMMEPFVHVHKGGILQKTLPGMRDCLVVLKPTDFQTQLLQIANKVEKYLEKVHLESVISVHPSVVSNNPEFSVHKRKLEMLALDPNASVKTQFLIELIRLANRLGEKVLVFSQFIDPLHHIKKLLKSCFSWKEGREVIYMDGEMGIKQRQHSIDSFNEKQGKAKVLLASQRACSEGINLVGASRVVLLDVVWNPSVERQAISRAYRLGQERVVYVYHLVTSMEVKKYARQAEKERLSELIFSAGDGRKRRSSFDGGVWEDKVLEAMVGRQSLRGIFERIVHQPKESDLVENFGFVDIV